MDGKGTEANTTNYTQYPYFSPPNPNQHFLDNNQMTPSAPPMERAIELPQAVLNRPNYPLAADHASDLALLLLESPDTQSKTELCRLISQQYANRLHLSINTGGTVQDLQDSCRTAYLLVTNNILALQGEEHSELLDKILKPNQEFKNACKQNAAIASLTNSSPEALSAKIEIIDLYYKIRKLIYPIEKALNEKNQHPLINIQTPEVILILPNYTFAADHACDLALLHLDFLATKNKKELRQLIDENSSDRSYMPLRVKGKLADLTKFIDKELTNIEHEIKIADENDKDILSSCTKMATEKCRELCYKNSASTSGLFKNKKTLEAKTEIIATLYQLRISLFLAKRLISALARYDLMPLHCSQPTKTVYCNTATPQDILDRPNHPLAADHACDVAQTLLESPGSQNKTELKNFIKTYSPKRLYYPLPVDYKFLDLITILKKELAEFVDDFERATFQNKVFFLAKLKLLVKKFDMLASERTAAWFHGETSPEVIQAKLELVEEFYKIHIVMHPINQQLAKANPNNFFPGKAPPKKQANPPVHKHFFKHLLQEPPSDCDIIVGDTKLNIYKYILERMPNSLFNSGTNCQASDAARIAMPALSNTGKDRIEGFITTTKTHHSLHDYAYIDGPLNEFFQFLHANIRTCTTLSRKLSPKNLEPFYENVSELPNLFKTLLTSLQPVLAQAPDNPSVILAKIFSLDALYFVIQLTSEIRSTLCQVDNTFDPKLFLIEQPEDILNRYDYPLASQHACDIAQLLITSPETTNKPELHHFITIHWAPRNYQPLLLQGTVQDLINHFETELTDFAEQIKNAPLQPSDPIFEKVKKLIENFDGLTKKYKSILRSSNITNEIIAAKAEIIECFYIIRRFRKIMGKKLAEQAITRRCEIQAQAIGPNIADWNQAKAVSGTIDQTVIEHPRDILGRKNHPFAADHASEIARLLMDSSSSKDQVTLKQILNGCAPGRAFPPMNVKVPLSEMLKNTHNELQHYIQSTSQLPPIWQAIFGKYSDEFVTLLETLFMQNAHIMNEPERNPKVVATKAQAIDIHYQIIGLSKLLKQKLENYSTKTTPDQSLIDRVNRITHVLETETSIHFGKK